MKKFVVTQQLVEEQKNLKNVYRLNEQQFGITSDDIAAILESVVDDPECYPNTRIEQTETVLAVITFLNKVDNVRMLEGDEYHLLTHKPRKKGYSVKVYQMPEEKIELLSERGYLTVDRREEFKELVFEMFSNGYISLLSEEWIKTHWDRIMEHINLDSIDETFMLKEQSRDWKRLESIIIEIIGRAYYNIE